MSEKKHVIWSNENLDIEDGWREAYAEFLESNKLNRDPNDENAIYDYMVEINNEYLGDEKMNLDIQLSHPILVIADVGRWNGRSDGYAVIESGNIKDCLHTECEYATWYVDVEGDLRCDAAHHDGRNHYLYRVCKDNVSDEQIEDLKDKIYEGKATRDDIERVTDRLGDEIAKVYGWDLNAPSINMEPYLNKGFNKEQLIQIRAALQVGVLSEEQIAIFAKPEFSAPQMAQLRYGLEAGLEMEPYAQPGISYQELAEIRKELLEEEKYGFVLHNKLSDQIKQANTIKENTSNKTPVKQTEKER